MGLTRQIPEEAMIVNYYIRNKWIKTALWALLLAAESILFAVIGRPVHQRNGTGLSWN